ncbi:hypothetical protein WSS_A29194 [Rhodococcus opacus M213]|uniref:Uncharacterized protein n=1 Tax=Rhodococcus opacus M213 TaxID=1129896 RepID=K8XLC1_RHOOP|nr:hypothetical protein [Rhodococcus opacus]EKT79047.1 hypothetical protein WSS_A29194 [Rhodococcus opacus M213]
MSVHDPAEGSDLAGDDQHYRSFPTSSAASFCIGSAIDHLALVRTTIELTQRSRPFALYTVTRTALLSASRAVWMLHPDERAERQRRSLEMAFADAHNIKSLVNKSKRGAAIPLTEQQQEAADKAAESCRANLARVKAAGKTLGMKFGPKDPRPSETSIIADAASWCDRENTGTAHASNLLWMTNSGYAHGLSWQTKWSRTIVTGENGAMEGRIRATTPEIAQAVGAAFLMTQAAVALYEDRSRPRSDS